MDLVHGETLGIELFLDHRDLRGLLAMEDETFGTRSASAIAACLTRLLGAAEDCGIAERVELYKVSIGIVVTVVLEDGRRVVCKIFGPRHNTDFLRATREVQSALFDAGFPAPRPLSPLVAVGCGAGWVDDYLDAPAPEQPSARVRGLLAATLVDFLELVSDFSADDRLRLGWNAWPPPTSLYPWPRSPRPDVNYGANRSGADWIERCARRGLELALADPSQEKMVGHIDWRPSNVRLSLLGRQKPSIAAVYDWDSVQLAPEAFIVANAAASDMGDPAEVAQFIEDYEQAKGGPMTTATRRAIVGISMWRRAVLARFEHARGLPEEERRASKELRLTVDAYEELAGAYACP